MSHGTANHWDGIVSAAVGFGVWHEDSICRRPPLPPQFGCILTVVAPPRRRWLGVDFDAILAPARIDDSELRLAVELGQRSGWAPDERIQCDLGPTLRDGDLGAAASMTFGLAAIQLTVRAGYTPGNRTASAAVLLELANVQRCLVHG
ncbi:MAG: hypothetical protein JST54_24620 [Deltaproteobacteria bacterium]|nr:hypothetical protein [Deltaproteobacteria bacterium]